MAAEWAEGQPGSQGSSRGGQAPSSGLGPDQVGWVKSTREALGAGIQAIWTLKTLGMVVVVGGGSVV